MNTHFSETVTESELDQWEQDHDRARADYFAAKEMKPTPGPWSFRSVGPHKDQDRAVYCGARRIASVPHPDRIEPSAENDANARLIAAAPMLLEALRGTMAALARVLDKHDPDSNEYEWIGEANEAILKATKPQ
jgi:hypothetical protein